MLHAQDGHDQSGHARFAVHVATLGRGPGRARALTREEAREAFGMVLRGEADPVQVGAFLMLLRYRGEDPDEITGLVEAAREAAWLGRAVPGGSPGVTASFPPVDLDWPSYGAGRTRAAPWFLLSALALADSGWRVLMHGSNSFSGGIAVADALAALGRPVQTEAPAVHAALRDVGFAYWPVSAMAPAVDRLLELRRLFGLRSPVNTVARLLDPADARASVDGVFHPPYIALHLAVAERLHRPALLVLKGGGGEAERAPGKPVAAHLRRAAGDIHQLLLPALGPFARPGAAPDTPARLAAIWRGEAEDEVAVRTVTGTIAMALLAMRQCDTPAEADLRAPRIWAARSGR
ncbi:glycosyl transferase family protein [Lichenicoccus sp.]|uniref:glycosyl transferase family protein n=1 Tax=Lichenicoccus sp. TaxID=2781899 RepID=UPI003D0BED8C